ncbi:hypothetical protein ACLOJK_034754, partial [Asimina triloba]
MRIFRSSCCDLAKPDCHAVSELVDGDGSGDLGVCLLVTGSARCASGSVRESNLGWVSGAPAVVIGSGFGVNCSRPPAGHEGRWLRCDRAWMEDERLVAG